MINNFDKEYLKNRVVYYVEEYVEEHIYNHWVFRGCYSSKYSEAKKIYNELLSSVNKDNLRIIKQETSRHIVDIDLVKNCSINQMIKTLKSDGYESSNEEPE